MAYEIGYRRPPKNSQFKKGKSGNPRGRPKGSGNFLTLLNKELDQPIVVNENGKKKTITRMQAMVKRMVSGALPASEIEDFVQKVMRDHLSDGKKLASILQIDYEQYSAVFAHVMEKHQLLTHAVAAIKRITVDTETLSIEIQVSDLCRYIHEALRLNLPEADAEAVYKVVFPYHTRRSKKGTVIIRPGKVTDKPNDIFDLPPIELKNLVRGVVWRDEHFKGKTIRQIADRENLSEGFVGRLIHTSMEFC